MADEDTLPEGEFADDDSNLDGGGPEVVQPAYRIFEGSKIAVGAATGPMWKKKLDAALTTYDLTYEVWNQIYAYYNNHQVKDHDTPVGTFHRGDSTENVIFSNLNIMLPAIYSKDPDISCSTTDEEDQPFCDALEGLCNVLFKKRVGLNAKYRIKKAAGFGLLTNCGILKLTFTAKDDSREVAVEELTRITGDLAKAKSQEDIRRLYGELEALEQNVEVLEPSGFGLRNILSHNLIIDPNAEQSDGMDAQWMIERVFLPTGMLTARFTKRREGEEEDDEAERVLVFKPTHKAQFTKEGGGTNDDGLGLVMQEIDNAINIPTSHQEDERAAFQNMYFTECYYVWDKITRRIFLFHRDDWAWPLWVWDEEIRTTRFFPYYLISFNMSTGGTISVGEAGYILDQQDEINEINRQKAAIRRSLFRFFFYNSEKVSKQEAEKFVKALRGEAGEGGDYLLGVRAGEQKIADMIEACLPPNAQYEHYFDKTALFDSINRITNTNDSLRGVQFKTNTNVASVKSYEQSTRISVGAKVDVLEDVVADIASTIGEISVQAMTQEDVEALIGKKLADGWKEMSLAEYTATYNVNVVAGSMEKPTSQFKKQEAIEVTQAVGQFAQAAPGTTLTIMLRVLEKAFTEVVIKPEDWDALKQEIAQALAPQAGMGNSPPGGQQPDMAQLEAAAQNMPPEKKDELIRMKESGASNEALLAFIQQNAGQAGAKTDGTTKPEPQQQQQRRRR